MAFIFDGIVFVFYKIDYICTRLRKKAEAFPSAGKPAESMQTNFWFDKSGEEILGLVAQLNSASDYGSEGSRFESWRGHLKQKVRSESCGLFLFHGKAELAQTFGGKQKNTARQRCGFCIFTWGLKGARAMFKLLFCMGCTHS